jgi:hypothetical protein
MTTSRRAAVAQVRQIGNIALQNALEILLLIELLETQNGNGINESISDAGAGGAGIVVRNSLITRLVLLVSQCCSIPRPRDLHLERGFDLLEEASGDLNHDSQAIAEAQAYFARCKGDARREKVKHFRDKYTAHLGEPKTTPKPAYKEVYSFARDTVTCIEKFAHAIGIADTLIADQIEAVPLAVAFWQPWMRRKD